MGLLIRLKKLNPPRAAKDIPIGSVRGVGRPKKAKKALVYQPKYFNEILADSSDDDDELERVSVDDAEDADDTGDDADDLAV